MDKDKQRMLELLADQTLFGLTEGETAELNLLKNKFPEFKDDDSFEMAAAAINLINLEINDSMPLHLQTKLAAQAEEVFGDAQKREFSGFEKNQIVSSKNEVRDDARQSASKPSMWRWFGWIAVAAACIVLAISLLLIRRQPQTETANTSNPAKTPEILQTPEMAKAPEEKKSPEIVQIPESAKTPKIGENNENSKHQEIVKNPESNKNQENVKTPKTAKTPELAKIPETAKTPVPELTAAQKREQLIATAPDVIQTNWKSAKDKHEILGDVVWSNSQQKGYIRLRNMPALDSSRETYQLWIVDEGQNKKTPVSGGIFNVAQTGEVIIPINAQTKIQKPKQFAVTKEKAGGVAVSKPDRIVAVAKI